MTGWARIALGDTPHWGHIVNDRVALYDAAPWDGGRATGQQVALAEAILLAPITPRNFIGLWNNFHAAAAKQGNAIPEVPLYFLKSTGSIIGPDATITPPATYSGRVLYEGELGIVIGTRCCNADESEAAAAIFGYTCINDVTALDLLTEDASFPQWARAKGCDGFGPVGPVIATGLDWASLTIRTRLAGRERQNYPAADMILAPARIVSLISREMTLHPGDLIACGTSLGALPMRPGQVVEVEIEGIGVLRNQMAPAASH
jgi:2-keto-4-pentenoate hydratase/2-oxohepta-3-ene-1,7-dioic acid hydratase in catechol pathway